MTQKSQIYLKITVSLKIKFSFQTNKLGKIHVEKKLSYLQALRLSIFPKAFLDFSYEIQEQIFHKKITVSQEFRLPWIVKLAFWSPAARCILSLKAIKVRERATVSDSDIWNIIAWNVQSVLRWWEKQKLPNRFDYGSIVMWSPYICGFMKSSWYTDQTIFDPINWDLYRNHHRAQLQHVLIHSKLGEKLQSNNTFLLEIDSLICQDHLSM